MQFLSMTEARKFFYEVVEEYGYKRACVAMRELRDEGYLSNAEYKRVVDEAIYNY